jgi:hypothetical protein
MKCAILGNGPSRVKYKNQKYDLIIGCNIPWCHVDYTVVMDKEIIDVWKKNPSLINVPVFFATDAWRHTATIKFRQYILDNNLFKSLEKIEPHYSSGHIAAKKAIELGYNCIDLYGMDSYFNQTMDSYTRCYISNLPTNHVKKWKELWNNIIDNNPNVVFNFIKE